MFWLCCGKNTRPVSHRKKTPAPPEPTPVSSEVEVKKTIRRRRRRTSSSQEVESDGEKSPPPQVHTIRRRVRSLDDMKEPEPVLEKTPPNTSDKDKHRSQNQRRSTQSTENHTPSVVPAPAPPIVPAPAPPIAPAPTSPVAPDPNSSGAPYPNSSVAPDPNSSGAPYPTSPGAPDPNSSGAPYPTSSGAPYPTSPGAPDPNSSGAPYPTSPGAPDPNSLVAPYPTSPVALDPNSPGAIVIPVTTDSDNLLKPLPSNTDQTGSDASRQPDSASQSNRPETEQQQLSQVVSGTAHRDTLDAATNDMSHECHMKMSSPLTCTYHMPKCQDTVCGTPGCSAHQTDLITCIHHRPQCGSILRPLQVRFQPPYQPTRFRQPLITEYSRQDTPGLTWPSSTLATREQQPPIVAVRKNSDPKFTQPAWRY